MSNLQVQDLTASDVFTAGPDEPIDRDVLHIRYEFMALPGLALTVAQTSHRHALSTARARALLEGLEAEGFLVSGPNGAYRHSTPPASA